MRHTRHHGLSLCALLAAACSMGAAPVGGPADWPSEFGVATCGMTTIPNAGPDGTRVHELSGLAGNSEVLYAVSDQGWLVTLAPVFEEGKLKSASITRAVELRDVDRKPLGWSERDAEGLDLVKVDIGGEAHEELWVSFERSPRVERFDTNGIRLGRVSLSKKVTRPSNFRSPNKAFEALAVVNGKVLTAPERPSKKSAGRVPLLGPDGRLSRFPLAEASDSSLVGLDVVKGKAGHLVALERSFERGSRRTVITLSMFQIPKRRARKVTKWVVATLDTARGYKGIDNFEGIVSLGDGRVLLVSDDNESKKQRQLLLCLDIDRLRP